MKMSDIVDAPKNGEWINLLYPQWGWQEAYWNGAAWVPPREGNPPTHFRVITPQTTTKHKGEI